MHDVPIFNLKWIKQFDGSTKNRSPEIQKLLFLLTADPFFTQNLHSFSYDYLNFYLSNKIVDHRDS